MKSREDETYVALTSGYGDIKERELYEIAMSLGRIADMLAEMNRYIVDYDDKTNCGAKMEEYELERKRSETGGTDPAIRTGNS